MGAGGKGSKAASEIRAELSNITKGSFKGLTSVIESLEGSANTLGESTDSSAAVAKYENILNGPLEQFKSNSQKIGGDVATLGDLVAELFEVQKQFLLVVQSSKKPSEKDLQKFLKPTSDIIGEIQLRKLRSFIKT